MFVTLTSEKFFIVFSEAFDMDLLLTCLRDVSEGKTTKIPVYDVKSNSR